jgi:hypothetical protein
MKDGDSSNEFEKAADILRRPRSHLHFSIGGVSRQPTSALCSDSAIFNQEKAVTHYIWR